MSKGVLSFVTDKLFNNLYGTCDDILQSAKPNKYAFNKCIESGYKPTINCGSLLEFKNVTNGYIFTKCIQERGLKLYKFINSTHNHNNFKYVHGTNKDTNRFVPNGSCKAGGLYFADDEHILNFSSYGSKLCEVSLQPHASVYIEDEKYKANEIDLDIDNSLTIEEYINQFTKNDLIKILTDQTKMQRIRKVIDLMNLDLVDDKICEKIMLLNISITNERIIQKMKEYVKSLAMGENQIIKLVSDNPSIILYLDDDAINQNLCKQLLKSLPLYLINKFAQHKYNDFTRDFFELFVVDYPHNTISVPDKYADNEMCIYIEKHNPSQLLADKRLHKYLTYAQCKLAIENGASFLSLPKDYKTYELLSIVNKRNLLF
jgi:hypothetical protein